MNKMKYSISIIFTFLFMSLAGQDKFIPTELVLERVEGFAANDRIEDIQINKNKIYIAGKTGVKSYDNNTFSLDSEVRHTNAIAVQISKKGDVFSAHTNRKIYRNNNLLFTLTELNDKFTDIALYRNKLWVGTNRGIYILHAESGKQLGYYNSFNSNLASDNIRFVFYSKSHDNIWIGTDKGVIEVKNDDKWKLDYHSEKLGKKLILVPLWKKRRTKLQGRLPIRVELQALTTEDFVRILTEPFASLTEQYIALMATEGVNIEFSDDGINAIANAAWQVNESTENIGARRLHTMMERLVEEISYTANDRSGETILIDAKYVESTLTELVQNEDLSRFIL